jgi:hypothetical protein
MPETKPDTRLARNLAHQKRIGFDLADIGGKGSLDAADIGIVGIVIDIDDRCEIVADAEPAQLMETGGENGSLLLQRKQIEIVCARQRREAARVLQPAHQPAFLIDEHQRRGWQRRDLGAERADLLGKVDVVVVLPGTDGVVEQDHPAESETRGEFSQPDRDGLAVEAEDEEFADLHFRPRLKGSTLIMPTWRTMCAFCRPSSRCSPRMLEARH